MNVRRQISVYKILQNEDKMACQYKWRPGYEKRHTWYLKKEPETNFTLMLVCSLHF